VGEMTETLYAHMNKRKKERERERDQREAPLFSDKTMLGKKTSTRRTTLSLDT
jgi:hypothetical protein